MDLAVSVETLPAASARTSSEFTPHSGIPSPAAMPLATLSATRTPVNEPGPRATTRPVTSDAARPMRSRPTWTSTSNRVECSRPASQVVSETTRWPSNSATLAVLVEVSSASSSGDDEVTPPF